MKHTNCIWYGDIAFTCHTNPELYHNSTVRMLDKYFINHLDPDRALFLLASLCFQ